MTNAGFLQYLGCVAVFHSCRVVQSVAVCGSVVRVVQCGAACCSVLQSFAMVAWHARDYGLWWFLVWCSVLQCVAVWCRVVQCDTQCCQGSLACVWLWTVMCAGVVQCGAVCCSVLQCVAVCCSVLQCVAAYCSAMQCVARVRMIRVWLWTVTSTGKMRRVAMWCRVLQCDEVWYSIRERHTRTLTRVHIHTNTHVHTNTHTQTHTHTLAFIFCNIG